MNQWTSSGLREELGEESVSRTLELRSSGDDGIRCVLPLFFPADDTSGASLDESGKGVPSTTAAIQSTQKNFNIGGSASIFGILGGNSGLHLRSWLPESGCCTSNMKINITLLVHL
jgi:hypothetical protein